MEMFQNLDTTLQVLWVIAIVSSVIFIVQAIMTFIGSDASDGTEADFNGDFDGTDAPFQLFSFRNLTNFLLGFSWSGISLDTSINNRSILLLISVIIGIAFVVLFFIIIRQIQLLAEDNSFKLSDTLNKTVEVYLSIPAEKQGIGKILVSTKGSVRELEAMTEGQRIETGSIVKIVKVENNSILIVEKI